MELIARILLHIIIAIVVISLTCTASLATGDLNVAILTSNNIPVTITKCTVRSFDDRDYTLEPTVSFRNESAAEIQSIQFQLEFFRHDFEGNKSEGPPLTFFFEGRFGAHTDIRDLREAFTQIQYPGNAFVRCSLSAIRYADGTMLHEGYVSSSKTQQTMPSVALMRKPDPFHTKLSELLPSDEHYFDCSNVLAYLISVNNETQKVNPTTLANDADRVIQIVRDCDGFSASEKLNPDVRGVYAVMLSTKAFALAKLNRRNEAKVLFDDAEQRLKVERDAPDLNSNQHKNMQGALDRDLALRKSLGI